jgi:predicted TIM-barrel fold metal-dependent hydrolase
MTAIARPASDAVPAGSTTDRVVFGTDWPADMAIDWPVAWVLSLESLTPEEKEAILYKNLEQLLGL